MKDLKIKNPVVSILGNLWIIKMADLEAEDVDGFTDPSAKEIKINNHNFGGVANFERNQKRALRHEIIHAYLFESGLGCNFQRAEKFGHDETTIDWFAIQAPRIFKTFQELGILKD